MASFLNPGIGREDFYNVTISLKVVQCGEENVPIEETEMGTNDVPFNTWDFSLSQFLEPWSSNLIGPFSSSADSNVDSDKRNCNDTLEKNFYFSIYPHVVLQWIDLTLLLFILAIVTYFLFKRLLHRVSASSITGLFFSREHWFKEKSAQNDETLSSSLSYKTPDVIHCAEAISGDEFWQNISPQLPPDIHQKTGLDRKYWQVDRGDTSKFLVQTVDLLNTGLDRVLWKTSSSGGVALVSSLARRSSSGPRPATPNNLTLRRSMHSATTLSPMSTERMGDEEETNLEGWDEYEQMVQNLGWRQNLNSKIARSRTGSETMFQLTGYVDSYSAIDGGHWRASCMIVTYLLKLLDKELAKTTISSNNSLQFIEFVSMGSARKGTKVVQPSAFDVLMVVQLPTTGLQEVLVSGKDDKVPSGKTVLVLRDPRGASIKRLVKEFKLEDGKKCCLSTRQTTFIAHGILDSALSEISSKSRKLSERLPYRVQKIESKASFIKMTLDTKPIKNIGFGIDEIHINIVPAICIVDGGLQRLPLYAVPEWKLMNENNDTSSRSSSVPKSPREVDGEVFWSLSTAAMEEAYFMAVDHKMKLSGVQSCHKTVLQLLKSLLQYDPTNETASPQNGSSLVPGYWLETIVFFLLLESSSEKWTYDCLIDRLSDSIIFLKSAIRNQRLPHFFISNPHLLKQFPYLQIFSWLAGDKQANLMSSLTDQEAETMLQYTEQCIERFPLRNVVKKEFSPEMWEYEFFVFN